MRTAAGRPPGCIAGETLAHRADSDDRHGSCRQGHGVFAADAGARRSRSRAAPRQRALPPEEQAARATAAHRATRARTSGQAHRPRRLRVGQPVVVGLRHRGDAARPDPRGRTGCVRARGTDHDRAPRRLVLLDPVVPPDDQGLPHRRRRVHGDARQLRAAARAGRRRRAAHRLRVDRLGVGRRRYGRPRLGLLGVRSRGSCGSRSRSS